MLCDPPHPASTAAAMATPALRLKLEIFIDLAPSGAQRHREVRKRPTHRRPVPRIPRARVEKVSPKCFLTRLVYALRPRRRSADPRRFAATPTASRIQGLEVVHPMARPPQYPRGPCSHHRSPDIATGSRSTIRSFSLLAQAPTEWLNVVSGKVVSAPFARQTDRSVTLSWEAARED